MKAKRANSREKILVAAADVAREAGPGSLSLDAVAHRAGVSKGGLLYNFPTKAKLLQALVEDHLRQFEHALESAETGESLLSRYIRLSVMECTEHKAPASWIFSAIAEDPDFLTPINVFKRQLLDRLKAETSDRRALMISYLALEGLRSMKLFDSDVLSDEERALLVSSLFSVAEDGLNPPRGGVERPGGRTAPN